MNSSTVSPTVQELSLKTYEQQAANIAHYYQNKLQEASKAHRRERYITWYTVGNDDESAWAMVVDYYTSRGECEPDGISTEQEEEIIGLRYDRLTEAEKAAFDKMIRQECYDLYLDDYYRDELIAIREKWNCAINKLESPGHKYSTQTFVIDAKYSPGVFHCLVCGAFSYSHDEMGNLIALPGLWTMSNGSLGNYIVCESCKDKPNETHTALARYFAECEAYRRARDETRDLADHIFPDTPIEEWTPDERADFEKFIEEHTALRLTAIMDDYDAKTAQTTANPTSQSGSQSPFLSFDDLMKLPPKQWLINQIIGERDIAMVFGEPGSGKTFMLIDLIFAACQGKRWANKFDVVRPLTVAYCAGEGISGLKDRFASALDHWGITTLSNFYFLPMAPQLHAKSRSDGIEARVKEWQATGKKLDILVVDTLHAATAGADENSAKDMGMVLDAIRAAIRDLGCAVILCHHTTKDGERERGSSSLHGAMDTMIKVKKNGAHTVECFKLKDGQPWNPQQFTLIAKGASVYTFWDGDAKSGKGVSKAHTLRDEIYQILLDNPFDEFSSNDFNKYLGENPNTINKRLNELLKDDKVERRQEKTGRKTVWWKLHSAIAAVHSVTN